MIRLRLSSTISSVAEAQAMLGTAINLEFGTLPPYLYAQMTIWPSCNEPAKRRLQAITHQEMIHLCLDANILNAIGGCPTLIAPTYPGPLPGDIGDNGQILIVQLLPFGKDAMQQGMNIEMPLAPVEFPQMGMAAAPTSQVVTIGQFYDALDDYLSTLPDSAWYPNRNQIVDNQFFPGQLFAVNNYEDAHRAIQIIVSEGEGASDSPLDFENELAHYYRFEEMFRNQVLTSSDSPTGYSWGECLGLNYDQAYPAIADPQTHDFSQDPPDARAAQDACTEAYTAMVDSLNLAFTGETAQLGIAVRKMFDLRMASIKALHTPLADPSKVSGPAFIYKQK